MWRSRWIEQITPSTPADKVAFSIRISQAEIQEESTQPVDAAMKSIGGTVFRQALAEVKHAIREEHIAAMNADLAQLKAKHAKARGNLKAKLQQKIIDLESTMH